MNFVHAIYIKLYLCIYDLIWEGLPVSIEFNTYSDVCDVYYSLIFITVFLSSVVLPMYFFLPKEKTTMCLKSVWQT